MNDFVRTLDDSSSQRSTSDAAPSAGRRTLLVALPTIVSLHPGLAAAHARSSSQLVLADTEPEGTVYCVKKPWGAKKTAKGWDIGDTGWLEVTELSDENHYYKLVGYDKKKKPIYKKVTRELMCRDGGDFYYEPKQEEKYSYASLDDGLDAGADGTVDSLDAEVGDGLLAQGGVDSIETTGYGGGGTDGGGKGGGKLPKVTVKKGGMASATALASFTGRYTITASV